MELMFDILVSIGAITYMLRFFTMLSGVKATEPAPPTRPQSPEHHQALENEILRGC